MIGPALWRALVPRIGLPAGAAHAKLPTGILAVSLASEARNAHEERPLTPAASKIEEFEVVHPLARVDELDGGRAMGDSSQRASIRARGAGWSRLGPPPISPRAVRASTTSALLSRHSYRSDLDRQIPTDSSCRRHEAYLRDMLRVLAHWPKDRYIELAPKYWAKTRATLDPVQLAAEIGPLTIPPAPTK